MDVAVGHRYRFTVDQYHRMGALGVFEPDCRVELLDGEIFEMTPVDPWHAGVVDWLNERFVRALADRAVVRVQNPIGLDDRSEPQPDLILLRPQRDSIAALTRVPITPSSWSRSRTRRCATIGRASCRSTPGPTFARSGS